jgi:hypothetical protein
MKDLQTVLDVLERYQTKRQDFDTFTEAIAIVKQMMQAKPVAWIVEFENREQELHFNNTKESLGESQRPLYTHPVPQAVPASFVLVPVEPTPEMVYAAEHGRFQGGSIEGYYLNMLAAAPKGAM